MIQLFISFALLFINQNPPDAKQIIKDKLQNQTECWNKGNMECFMEAYWESDSLQFIGGSGITYGWDNTLQRYKAGYPTERERGVLTFTIKSIDLINLETCFVVGMFHLTREIGDDEGHFSLLWKKKYGEWVIVADHSSN